MSSRDGRLDGNVDVGLDLLDRLVVDATGTVIGRVDDIVLEEDLDDLGSSSLRVTGLLLGPEAWGRALGGRIGRWVTGVAQALHPGHSNLVPIGDVAELEPSVLLHTDAARYDGVLVSEQWLARYIVGRIPGGTHASE